jgi:cytochrome c556
MYSRAFIKPFFLIIGLVLGSPALAHTSDSALTGIYKERHDAMEAMKDALVSTKMMVTGKAEFDAAKVKENAAVIAGQAGDPLLELFPEGTNDAPSEALANIWTDWETFTAKSNLLKERAEALGQADGQKASMAAFAAMAKEGCGGCHKTFRLEKE